MKITYNKMTEYESKIDLLLLEIASLRQELSRIKDTTSRMDKHISFVESVFDVVRIPFFSLMNAVTVILPQSPLLTNDD
jgi:hypothetical protein